MSLKFVYVISVLFSKDGSRAVTAATFDRENAVEKVERYNSNELMNGSADHCCYWYLTEVPID